MNYTKAIEAMNLGSRIKLPEWGGFWFMHEGKRMVKLKSGKIEEHDKSKGTDLKDRTDWEVTDMWMTYEEEIIVDKDIRVNIDQIIQYVKTCPPTRERSLAMTKLQEAVMWMGMDLKRLGTPNPYPNSYDTSNTKIEPTADGLKL